MEEGKEERKKDGREEGEKEGMGERREEKKIMKKENQKVTSLPSVSQHRAGAGPADQETQKGLLNKHCYLFNLY